VAEDDHADRHAGRDADEPGRQKPLRQPADGEPAERERQDDRAIVAEVDAAVVRELTDRREGDDGEQPRERQLQRRDTPDRERPGALQSSVPCSSVPR
jgi:hypothetical protein